MSIDSLDLDPFSVFDFIFTQNNNADNILDSNSNKKANLLLNELIETEKSYIEQLEFIIIHFGIPLFHLQNQSNKIILNKTTTDIGNCKSFTFHEFFLLEHILIMHRSIYKNCKNSLDFTNIQKRMNTIFLEYFKIDPELYINYATSYSNCEPSTFLDKILFDKWEVKINSLLITPIQRICRYLLLFEKLQKLFPKYSVLESLCSRMKLIANSMNIARRASDARHKLKNNVAINSANIYPLLKKGFLTKSGLPIFYVLQGTELLGFENSTQSSFIERYTISKNSSLSLENDDIKVLTREKHIILHCELDLFDWVNAFETAIFIAKLNIFNDLNPTFREFIYEGKLDVGKGETSNHQLFHCFLFNDMLLFVKEKFVYLVIYFAQVISVIDPQTCYKTLLNEKVSLSLEKSARPYFKISTKFDTFICCTSTKEEKELWISFIREQIEKLNSEIRNQMAIQFDASKFHTILLNNSLKIEMARMEEEKQRIALHYIVEKLLCSEHSLAKYCNNSEGYFAPDRENIIHKLISAIELLECDVCFSLKFLLSCFKKKMEMERLEKNFALALHAHVLSFV